MRSKRFHGFLSFSIFSIDTGGSRPLSSLGAACLMISPLALGLTVSIPGLERALQQYTLEPSEKPFDLKSVPLATTPMAEQRPGKALLMPKAHVTPWLQSNQDGRCAEKREQPFHLLLQAAGTAMLHACSSSCMLLSQESWHLQCLSNKTGSAAPCCLCLEPWVTSCACSCRKHCHRNGQTARESGSHSAGDLPG